MRFVDIPSFDPDCNELSMLPLFSLAIGVPVVLGMVCD